MRCKSRFWVDLGVTVAVAATLLTVTGVAVASHLPTLRHSAAAGPIKALLLFPWVG